MFKNRRLDENQAASLKRRPQEPIAKPVPRLSILSLEIVVHTYEKKKTAGGGGKGKKNNVCVTVQATYRKVQRTLKTFSPN